MLSCVISSDCQLFAFCVAVVCKDLVALPQVCGEDSLSESLASGEEYMGLVEREAPLLRGFVSLALLVRPDRASGCVILSRV